MEFTSSLVGTNIWFKASMEKYGNQYYTFITVFDDEFLIMEKCL